MNYIKCGNYGRENRRPFPVFVKEASSEWVYAVDFTVSKTTYREQGIEKFSLGGGADIQIELEGGQVVGTKRNP